MNVIILAPYHFHTLNGNTLRPKFQCEGLIKNEFHNFKLLSLTPFGNRNFEESKIRKGVFSIIPERWRPKGFRFLFEVPIFKKIKAPKGTIVHAHNFYSFYLIPKHCKKIIDLHTFKSNEMYYTYSNNYKGGLIKKWIYKNILSRIVHKLEYNVCKKADLIITASDNITNVIGEKFGIPSEKFRTINNAINTSKYISNKHNHPFSIGVIGGFKDQINKEMIPEIIKLAQKTNDKIELIGSIDKRDAKLFEKYSNVTILGYVTSEAYLKKLSEISVMYAPYSTLRNGGGSRNKILEASISATPVITTPGGAEGFDNINLLAIGDNVDDCLVHINKFKQKKNRIEVGEKLKAFVTNKHDYIKESNELKDLYNEVSNLHN